MKLISKIALFLLFSFFVTSFFVQAQSPDLRPPKTKMVGRSLEEPEGATITHYRYQSSSSKKQIVKFYRLLFSNRGFKELKSRGSSKAFFFFAKQEDGVIATLTFLGSPSKSLITYSLSNHHFSVQEED